MDILNIWELETTDDHKGQQNRFALVNATIVICTDYQTCFLLFNWGDKNPKGLEKGDVCIRYIKLRIGPFFFFIK